MLNRCRFAGILLLAALSSISVLAQDACPALVQQALEYTDRVCSAVERNQACYGNQQIEAVPQPDAANFTFSAPGDIANIADIQSLNLSGLSTPDLWGVSLMSVQANLPDSTPGQNVTVLLFGDVSIENKNGISQPVLLPVTANTRVRVRTGPGTQNSQISSLNAGYSAQADGRNAAGDWLRIQLADGSSGWASAELLTVTGDGSALSVVEGTEIAGTTYGPMQAFYFTSGIGNPACAAAPPDGILLQTPEGEGEINLLINEVQINVGSTVYLTAQPGGLMTVNVLEGQVTATTAGTTVVVPAGARAMILLDENGAANGAPVVLRYTDTGLLNGLLALMPEAITPALPLTTEDLTTPHAGQWRSVVSSVNGGCRVNQRIGDSTIVPVTFDNDRVNIAGISGRAAGQNTYAYFRDGGSFTLQFTGGYSAVETGVYTSTFTTTVPDTSAPDTTAPDTTRPGTNDDGTTGDDSTKPGGALVGATDLVIDRQGSANIRQPGGDDTQPGGDDVSVAPAVPTPVPAENPVVTNSPTTTTGGSCTTLVVSTLIYQPE